MNYSKLIEQFKKIYGESDEQIRVFEAPGRLNIIGEHMDYNGGHVFPAALSMKSYVVARKNNSSTINLAVSDLSDRVSADAKRLAEYRDLKWGNYQLGVAHVLKQSGYNIVGCDAYYHSTVPYGAGLSSSAAVEVSSALMFLALGENDYPEKMEIAELCKRAENKYVGMNCGIMDQFASVFGKKDHAMLLNCKTMRYDYVPLNMGKYCIIITNTNAPHKLTDSDFNKRRSECESALEIINQNGGDYENLCEISSNKLPHYEKYFYDMALYRRARHCVSENERTQAVIELLSNNDIEGLGKLLCEGNDSMKKDYEATGKELDAVFEIAMSMDFVLGSRMTGAGFGGCNLSLVRSDKIEEFKATMKKEYKKSIGYEPSFYQTKTGDGGREVEDWDR